ncbi:MAG: hypothetical protein ACTSPD_20810 [Promethearchaeota archaeon]
MTFYASQKGTFFYFMRAPCGGIASLQRKFFHTLKKTNRGRKTSPPSQHLSLNFSIPIL